MRIADNLLDDEGRIDMDRWMSAAMTGQPVGTCHCGSPVIVDAGTSAWGKTFLSAVCLSTNRHEATIPHRRVLRAPMSRAVVGVVSESVLAAGRARDAAILGERE